MAGDDRKLSYSERDRMRREGGRSGGRPPSRRDKAEAERRSQEALVVADSLFTDEKGGQEGKEVADAVRAAHGTSDLASACRAYADTVGPPATAELASLFLDAGEKELSLVALDELIRRKEQGDLELDGGLKRQIRILSEDFDDDLASRAEDILE
jgi:hypothetical protein